MAKLRERCRQNRWWRRCWSSWRGPVRYGRERLPLKTCFVWCNSKLIVCVKSHFRIRSSANMLNNRSPLPSSVFEVWFFFFFSDFQAKCNTPLLLLGVFFLPFSSFYNHAGLSFFFFFVRGFCSSVTDFSGTTLMRPSHRFHGDSHKTVKFPLFQKSYGGVFCNCQRHVLERRVASFSKVNLSFLVNSASFAKSFYQKTHSLAVSKNANTPIVE